jgi:hypothetical protein
VAGSLRNSRADFFCESMEYSLDGILGPSGASSLELSEIFSLEEASEASSLVFGVVEVFFFFPLPFALRGLVG